MRFLPVSIRYIFTVYIAGLVFFTLFRIILVVANIHQLADVPNTASLMAQSMFMGLRFDTVISGYLLALPVVVLLIAELAGFMRKGLLLGAQIFLSIVYSLAFFICASDIPFYSNYSNRLNVSILSWTASPLFMAKMVVEDKEFLAYFLFFVLIVVVFVWLMKRIYRKFKDSITAPKPKTTAYLIPAVSTSLLFLALMFLGIRGRTDEKSPIVVGTAFFCNYNLPNQAGLNPVFTLMVSWQDGQKDENKKLEFVPDATAMAYAQNYLHVPAGQQGIARHITATEPPHRYNVVVILMESMSAYYMQRFGNTMQLTPNLDTLAQNAYFFTNFYSAGMHTFNGIFSTLYSYPALMGRHTMEGAVIPPYTGLPGFFSDRGYETMYFTTHDDQFDNVGGFLSANHMQTIYSKKHYPSEKVRSTLGVSDHDMFDFSLPKINERAGQHKPFLAVYMTTSNHNPYVIPDGIPFTAKHTNIRGGCVEYADWAIGYYMHKAATMPWYDSTIFVFLGDHGAKAGGIYGNMHLSFNHIPCIIYSPMFRGAHKEFAAPGGQIDVFPTIAGLMGGDYTNNTMGIDMLQTPRQWMYFSQDDKIGVVDTSSLYIWQQHGPEYMFNIATHAKILQLNRTKADSMKTYAFSMIQATQWLRNNNKTGK